MTPGNEVVRVGGAQPIYDVQGNQRAVTDSTQTVTATQVYDAFGDQIGGSGSTASALQWQGDNLYATYAADAGLILAGSRYYDPQVGRFITRDTDLNQRPYIYCGGDPVNNGDPSGCGPLQYLWDLANGAYDVFEKVSKIKDVAEWCANMLSHASIVNTNMETRANLKWMIETWNPKPAAYQWDPDPKSTLIYGLYGMRGTDAGDYINSLQDLGIDAYEGIYKLGTGP
jgi:RHS repeat-associated protein